MITNYGPNMGPLGPLVDSTPINGQLIAYASADAMMPPGASQPNIGVGAAPGNLPGLSFAGGAMATPMVYSAASGTPDVSTVSTVAGDVRNLPAWENPLVLLLLLMVLSYLALRFVHWRA